jgi:hypothetical protein
MQQQTIVERKKRHRRMLAGMVIGVAFIAPNLESWMTGFSNAQWSVIAIGLLLLLWP